MLFEKGREVGRVCDGFNGDCGARVGSDMIWDGLGGGGGWWWCGRGWLSHLGGKFGWVFHGGGGDS
jgi:hypothetical protein